MVTNRAIDWRRAQARNPAFSREEMAATEGAQLNWARRGMPRQIHYAPIISTRPDLAASPRLDMLGKFCLYKKPVVFEYSWIYGCVAFTVCTDINFFFIYQACHIPVSSATEVNQS